jgi:hypothetical protein
MGSNNQGKKPPMASKKKVAVRAIEPIESAADHPEHATELPKPATDTETVRVKGTGDREEQIRQVAHAACDRRDRHQGSPEHDWLDAEAEWERGRSR